MPPRTIHGNRDVNQSVVTGGVSYSDHQEVRDLVLSLRQDMVYLREAVDRLDKFDKWARQEWEQREAIALARLTILERESERSKGEAVGITRSAAFISAVFTLIGMFLAIAISVVVK